VHYGSRYMKSVVYHAPKTALENVEVIFGLWTFHSLHWTHRWTIFSIFFREKVQKWVQMCIVSKIWDLLGRGWNVRKIGVEWRAHLQITCLGFGLISIDENARTRGSQLPSKSCLYL
jgi:hypothetical protein